MAPKVCPDISHLLGLSTELESISRNRSNFRLSAFPEPYGVKVVVEKILSKIYSSLEFDIFSGSIIAELNRLYQANKDEFILSIITLENMHVKFRPSSAELSELSEIDFKGWRAHVTIDDVPDFDDAMRLSALSILLPLSVLLVNLVPKSDLDEAVEDLFSTSSNAENMFAEEGMESIRLSKIYERSRVNRAIAIELHGLSCFVCDFNFNDFYGSIAAEYVEIHHLTPVSMMGASRVVDPRTELVPLCANCHRMVHRRWPPYGVGELRSAIKARESGEYKE